MPALPFLPDDVLSEIISWITPPPPFSMASSPPSLLSEVLERYRPPTRSKKDLTSFWKSSKRFKALSDQAYYSYIVVRDLQACTTLAGQLEKWSNGKDSPALLVVGLSFEHGSIASSTYPNLNGMSPIFVIASSLRNLEYLDLGGEEASVETLLSLLSARLRLRSLVGLAVTPTTYHHNIFFLSSLSLTLDHLQLVVLTILDVVNQRSPKPTVALPLLRSFAYHPFQKYPDDSQDDPLEDSLVFPSLQTFSVGMEGCVGEYASDVALDSWGGPSLREHTLPMLQIVTRDVYDPELLPGLETIVFHLSTSMDIWSLPPTAIKTFPSIRNLVFIQAGRLIPEERPLAHRSLSAFASKEVFPSLERVYYVPEDEEADVWKLWSRIAVNLSESGVKVIYL
ncbi:hypothetical protein BDY24DRAFT_390807 [Mrakia frigida]|uniref:uncharacterized protein n=1 Tax=Mrakia frigida TaxID=29902 RepID=UPI003FCC008E